MKSIKFLFLLACFTGMTVSSLTAQNTETQTRTVQSFDKISVSTGINLYLTQGNNEKVTVEADPDIIDNIMTEVKNGTLDIHMKKSNNVWGKKSNSTMKVFVTFDDLTKLNASSAADVYSQNQFNLEELQISSSSAADITIDNLTAQFISVDTSSGADAKITGKTVKLKANASSGSDIDCQNLVSADCDVAASSGADATVNATKSLKADASSGADIVYYGNPEQKTINKSSGGSVKAK